MCGSWKMTQTMAQNVLILKNEPFFMRLTEIIITECKIGENQLHVLFSDINKINS